MSFADRDCVFWMDGELVPGGAGIFEGARSDRSDGIAG